MTKFNWLLHCNKFVSNFIKISLKILSPYFGRTLIWDMYEPILMKFKMSKKLKKTYILKISSDFKNV